MSKALAETGETGAFRVGIHIIDGVPPVTVYLRSSAQARRISLRVSRLDGKVTLTHPVRVSEHEALEFAYSRAEWLRGHVTDVPETVEVTLGAVLPVEGRERQLVSGSGRRVALHGSEITIPGAPETAGRRLESFLKAMARDRLAAASDVYAARLGRTFARISLRDTRSRWGSCSSRGTLMYSWRLIMAPPEVLQYVAAHEVAHLAEMNHSKAYWDGLLGIHGPYDAPRRWLRDHGGALHRYRFKA